MAATPVSSSPSRAIPAQEEASPNAKVWETVKLIVKIAIPLIIFTAGVVLMVFPPIHFIGALLICAGFVFYLYLFSDNPDRSCCPSRNGPIDD